tara:strand:- start:328 stop:714 length:387 start_codon:yes stop_codon:yes gene_type:complete
MFQRNRRGFRHRSNGRGRSSRENGYMKARSRSNSFSNNQTRYNFKSIQSAEKLLEKYNSLAKEAMSLGDKTLCENYLQHADHFMRVVEDRSKNKDQSKANVINKSPVDDKRPSENSEIKQEDVTKNQE